MLDDLSKKVEEWSRWDNLRKLGSAPLVRSSLIFAAAGYVLLWNEKVQGFLTIKFDAHLSLWRIWMIYYGGVSVAVATALYSAFCPRPIKQSGSAFELAQQQSGHLFIMGTGAKYLADVEALESGCSTAERKLWPTDRPRDNLVATLYSIPNGREFAASIIVYAWRLHNIKRPRLRLAILIIYGVGFVLLAIPAMATFGQVTAVGLRTMF